VTPPRPRTTLLESAAWVASSALAGALLVYPTSFVRPPVTDMESAEVIQPFGPFGVLFVAWALAMLTLLVLRGRHPARSAGNVAFVALFAAVFWGFWIQNTPWGGGFDSLYTAGIARYVQEHGVVSPGIANLVYFDFPGLHIVAAGLGLASGLDVLTVATLLRMTFAVLGAAVVYCSIALVVDSSALALIGAQLFVQGNIIIVAAGIIFFPATLGLVLLETLWLYAMVGQLAGGRLPEAVGFLIVFVSLVISHFVTSATAVVIVGMLAALRLTGRSRELSWQGALRVLVVAAVLVAWEGYWTVSNFKNLLLSLADFHFGFAGPQQSLEGGVLQLPAWATATRLVWLALAAGFVLVALLRLAHRRTLMTSLHLGYAGGLVGVLVAGGLATVLSEGGLQFSRLIYLPPLFSIPLVMGLFVARRRLSRVLVTVLVALLAVTALPSFLVSQHGVSSSSVHEDQVAVGRYVELLYGDGAGLSAYGNFNGARAGVFAYFTRDATIRSHDRFERPTFWPAENALLDEFIAEGSGRCRSVYVFEERAKTALYRMTYAIDPQDPRWETVREELAGSASLVYANGNGRVYVPATCST